MNRVKALIFLDHNRLSYFDKNTHRLKFGRTHSGKLLGKLVASPLYLHLSSEQAMVNVIYPKIPSINKNGQPKQVTKKQLQSNLPRINKYVVHYQPKIVIGLGKLGNDALLGMGNVKTNHGQVTNVRYTYQGKSVVVPTLVTYSLESTFRTPYKSSIIKSDFQTAHRIIKGYTLGLNKHNYLYVTDFNILKKIFLYLSKLPKDHVVAVDTETNSLKPWNKGSKIIVFSLSWKIGYGVCIPFKHKDTPWNDKQIGFISKWLKAYMMSDHYKVLHNGKYDIKFMMCTLGLPYAKNCIDTLLMHYIGITEEPNVSRGLKPLAEQYTSMGNYSKPLQDYKQQREDNHKKAFLKRYKRSHKLLKRDYKPLHNPIDNTPFNYEWIPIKLLAPYAAMDTDATLRLYHVFKPVINGNQKWINIIYHFYPALENSLARMEANGMYINMKQADSLKKTYRKKITTVFERILQNKYVKQLHQIKVKRMMACSREMMKPIKQRDQQLIRKYHRYVGRQSDPMENTHFNPNSSDDLRNIVYMSGLAAQIPFNTKFKTTYAKLHKIKKADWSLRYVSVGSDTLKYLENKDDSDFFHDLLLFRKLVKLDRDFVIKLPKMKDSHDIIHPEFIMSRTRTHRLASQRPNMQQLPARDTDPHHFDYIYSIKSMFTSRFHHGQIINLDFKSFEIFVVAALSGEPKLIEPLCNGFDIHKTNASRAFNIPYDRVTPALRKNAKAVTFGVLYGISIHGLANRLNIPEDKAENLYKRIIGSLPVLQSYIHYLHDYVKKHRYVSTIDGFRRRLPNIWSSNPSAKASALRDSVNSVVQGSTTYFLGLSIIIIQKLFHKLGLKAKVIDCVHDSIVIDSPEDETDTVMKYSIYVMEHLPVHLLSHHYRVNDFKHIPKKLWNTDGTFRFPFITHASVSDDYNNQIRYIPKHFIKIKPDCRYDYLRTIQLEIELMGYLDNHLISKSRYCKYIMELTQHLDKDFK